MLLASISTNEVEHALRGRIISQQLDRPGASFQGTGCLLRVHCIWHCRWKRCNRKFPTQDRVQDTLSRAILRLGTHVAKSRIEMVGPLLRVVTVIGERCEKAMHCMTNVTTRAWLACAGCWSQIVADQTVAVWDAGSLDPGVGSTSAMFDSSTGERSDAKYSTHVIASPILSKNQSG